MVSGIGYSGGAGGRIHVFYIELKIILTGGVIQIGQEHQVEGPHRG